MGSERIHGWLKCCRLCLMDDGVKMPIFGEEGIHREVAKKIESCLPIVIYNSDPLSKLICQRCLFMLDTVYDFHQKCVQTTVVLTNQLLAIKNSSAVTVYLLTLEKNDLLACSSSGKEPKRKHPTPDQIPVEDVLAVEQQPKESRSADPHSEVRVKQEVPQIVNVVGSYGGELRRRLYTPLSLPEEAGVSAPTQVKQEPETATLPFKRVTPWYCKFCNKYYKNKGTLYKHRKYFCSKKGFECHKCNRVFAVESDKLVHLATHLRVYVNAPESRLVTCSQCEKRFLSQQMLESHARLHKSAPDPARNPGSESDVSELEAPPTRFPCEYCPRTYAQKGKLNRHLSEEHRAEMFPSLGPVSPPPPTETVDVASLFRRLNRPSPLSKKKLSTSTTLLRELLLKQQGPVPKCEQCNKPFVSRQGLANHMRIHLPKNQKVSQKCLDCGKMFGSREGLRYHTNKFHRGLTQNKHHCRICDTSFASRSQWLLHMVTHPISSKKSGEDPPLKVAGVAPRRKAQPPMLPSCIYCDQEFDEVSELTAHLTSVHGLAKHFPCKVCFKLFAHRSNMARHMKIHQRTNQYTFHPCNVCGKKFLSKETAEKHASMHVPSQTFHCPQCNKIFFKMEGLLNHACSPGAGGQGADCPSCNFPYTKGHECRYREDGSRIIFIGDRVPKKKKKSQLRTGRFYKCKHCVATFTSSYSHNSHMKIHTGLYRAKHANNVILSVPSFVQPHQVEVKAEPLDTICEDQENSFTWMHPKNLKAGVADDGNLHGDTGTSGVARLWPDLVGIGADQVRLKPSEQVEGESDLRPQETKQLDGTSVQESGVIRVQPQEPGDINISDTLALRPLETMCVESSLSDNIDTLALRPLETMCVDGRPTLPNNSDIVTFRPLETMCVDGTLPNISKLHPQETEHVDGTSANNIANSTLCPQETGHVDGIGTSANNSGEVTLCPQGTGHVDGTGTSVINSGVVTLRPQETMCGDGTWRKNSDYIRVRPPETMCVDKTYMDKESKHEGSATSLGPQEVERVYGSTSASPEVGLPRSEERLLTTRSSVDSFRGDAGFTEICADSSKSFTANHTLDRGSTSHNRPPGSVDDLYSQALQHPQEIYDCNICGKAFSTPEELTTHVRWHGDPSKMPYKCPFCDRGFVNSPAVYQHVLMNHKEQRY